MAPVKYTFGNNNHFATSEVPYNPQPDYPTKILLIDLLDPNLNNKQLITCVCTNPFTGVITNIPLTNNYTNTVSFLENEQGFKRCFTVSNRSITNEFKYDDFPTVRSAMGNFNPSQSKFTLIFFSNTMGTDDNRSGLLSAYNISHIIGYQGYNGSNEYVAVWSSAYSIASFIYGSDTNNDIRMFCMTYDYSLPNNRFATPFNTSQLFHYPLNNVNPTITISDQLTGPATFYFGRSRESSYHFAPGGLCAGICIFNDVLNEEQLRWIYDNRKFPN